MKKNIINFLLFTIVFGLGINSSYGTGTWETGFKIETGWTTVDAYHICKKVKSNSSTDYFIPTKTSNEWSKFRSNIGSRASLNECVTYHWVHTSRTNCRPPCNSSCTQYKIYKCRANGSDSNVNESFCSNPKPTGTYKKYGAACVPARNCITIETFTNGGADNVAGNGTMREVCDDEGWSYREGIRNDGGSCGSHRYCYYKDGSEKFDTDDVSCSDTGDLLPGMTKNGGSC